MSDVRSGSFVKNSLTGSGEKNGRKWYRYAITIEYTSGKQFSIPYFHSAKEVASIAKTLQPGTPIEITLDEKNNASVITVTGSAPPGATQSQPESATPPIPGTGFTPKSTTKAASVPASALTDEDYRSAALGIAVRHYGNVMANSDKLAKLVKKSETLENLEIALFEFATKALSFIKGTLKVGNPKSSTEDVGPGANLDQPDVPAGSSDDDDVPF